MSNYSQTTIFTPKDSLPTSDPNKTIFGAQFDVEFGNIATAINSKPDSGSAAQFLSVAVTGSSVPANGIYLPSSNTLGIASNSVQRGTISSAGAWAIVAPTSAGTALTVSGISGSHVVDLASGSGAATASPDLYVTRAATTLGSIQKGANISLGDTGANTFTALQHAGGHTELWQYNGSWNQVIDINTNRQVTIQASASGVPLTVNTSTQYAVVNTTNASGSYIAFQNAGATVGYIGTGSSTMSGAAAGDLGLASATGQALRLGYGSGGSTAIAISSTGYVTINSPGGGNVTINGPVNNGQFASNLASGNQAWAGGPGTSGSGGAISAYFYNDGPHYVNLTLTATGYSGANLTNGPSGEQFSIAPATNVAFALGTNNTARVVLNTSGYVNYIPTSISSPGYEIGFRDIPNRTQNGSYTLVDSDRGQAILFVATSGITVTLPSSVVAANGTIIITNNTGGNITISAAGTLNWFGGAGSIPTGNRTLAYGGVATLYCQAGTNWYVWGVGLS